MVFRKAVYVLTFLSIALFSCQPAPGPEPKAAAPDPAPINALRDQYASTYNAGDAAALGNLYTEDAVMMNNHQAAVEGRPAIQQYHQSTFEKMTGNITINSQETQIAGDWAYDRGTFSITLTPKPPAAEEKKPAKKAAAPAEMKDTGYYIVILKHGADGSWKVHREVGNSDQPMMAMH